MKHENMKRRAHGCARKAALAAALVALGAVTAQADVRLRLSIESGGGTQVTVAAGATVDYVVLGELSDTQNQGLAMFAFDLSFDGGALPQADPPTTTEMLNFASPLGLNNPAGFGGTPIGGDLIQVGGAQNTIEQGFAPQPVGDVMLGIGHASTELVRGSLTAPATAGVYTLSAANLFANAIRAGASDADPYWAVMPVEPGAVQDLTITVIECNVTPYCTAKVNSQGCTPAIGSSGGATLTGPDDFHVTAASVINQSNGLMFWGLAPDGRPFMGGTLCVAAPVVRTAVQSSGGTPGPTVDCSGTYDHFFSQAEMAAAGFGPGTIFYAQYWQRDVTHPDGTGVGLTDALAVTVCP